jgi:hypothetical protein
MTEEEDMDWKLELVSIPVPDFDRAKASTSIRRARGSPAGTVKLGAASPTSSTIQNRVEVVTAVVDREDADERASIGLGMAAGSGA